MCLDESPPAQEHLLSLELAPQHQQEEEKRRVRDDECLYEMFELPYYADMTEEHVARVQRIYKRKALIYHPDRGGTDEAMQMLNMGRHVLLTPDLKSDYDEELRRQCEEEGGWSTMRWWARWTASNAMLIGGGVILLAGIAAVPVSFGSSCVFGVPGGALLSAGIQGHVKNHTSADCNNTEFTKSVAVAGVVGAVGGVWGSMAGVAITGTVDVAASMAIAAGAGAATAASGHTINDTADLAITNGLLGEHLQENVHDAKTNEEVFSVENGVRLASVTAIGAVVGMAWNGCAVIGGANAAPTNLTDDVVAQGARKSLTHAVASQGSRHSIAHAAAIKVAVPKVLDKFRDSTADLAAAVVTIKKVEVEDPFLTSDEQNAADDCCQEGKEKEEEWLPSEDWHSSCNNIDVDFVRGDFDWGLDTMPYTSEGWNDGNIIDFNVLDDSCSKGHLMHYDKSVRSDNSLQRVLWGLVCARR